MKLLIDENLPKRLKLEFPENKVFTVNDVGWNSKKNGVLLKLMMENGFDVLLTFDKNLQYQQNFTKYPISVLIVNASDNTFKTISPLIPKINKLLKIGLKIGPTEVSARV